MLARLQQFTTALLLLAATGWLLARWNRSPVIALLGCALVVLAYTLFLAIEFVALWHFNQADPVPQATPRQLLRAWWGESVTAPRVFCWRQPFRANAEPDYLPGNGRRGVVLVHGFACNRGLWTPWLTGLRTQGHAFVAVNLEPLFGSIDNYAPAIDAAVEQVRRDTGLAPVLVCHSMGGLAARAWLRWWVERHPRAVPAVHHVVTIGTPHGGTWLARFSHVTNGRQMRLASRWTQQLAMDEQAWARQHGIIGSGSPLGLPTTCWYSNCDNIVFPASTATLPGADNRLLSGVAHVQMAFSPDILRHSLGLLAADA
jgi:triacylglycerol esterase/lipase EstA (alpha/beta hydrolase family)